LIRVEVVLDEHFEYDEGQLVVAARPLAKSGNRPLVPEFDGEERFFDLNGLGITAVRVAALEVLAGVVVSPRAAGGAGGQQAGAGVGRPFRQVGLELFPGAAVLARGQQALALRQHRRGLPLFA